MFKADMKMSVHDRGLKVIESYSVERGGGISSNGE